MARGIGGWALARLGGRASARLIAVFAAVLALDNADAGAIGAMATRLEAAFGIGTTDLGLMLTLSSAVGAVATLPFGWLVDRVHRTRMLAIAILLWGVSMSVLACSPSYAFLLVTRVAVGGVIAAAGPTIASLVGDWFDPRRRGRVWGAILSGEIVGTGFGFIVAGQLATFSWRVGMASLVLPAIVIAWWVHRLPEPSRGGESRVVHGQESLDARGASSDTTEDAGEEPARKLVQREVEHRHIRPREHLVLAEDPGEKSLWWAMIYVLRIPSNVVLILASALGYYFFAGARTFGVQFIEGYFQLDHSDAIWLVLVLGVGGLGGVVLGGWLGDHLLARGHVSGRPIAASAAYLTSSVFFLITLLTPTPGLAMVPFLVAALALGAMNPPLDAARLDIMHPRMWGRAEAVRMFFRRMAQALAPVLFGIFAGQVFGGGPTGLRDAFLVMLVPLFVSGLISLTAIRTYPRDVATAEAYAERTGDARRDEDS